MIGKFKTLFFVKSSLIFLYLALTIPIPFITIGNLRLFSLVAFVLGLILITDITGDYVETCDLKISYRTNFLSRLFGKKNWEIPWKDLKSIKSVPTSQGSKVYYFVTKNEDFFLMPQRVENLESFLNIISQKTGLDISGLSYISPLWTYKLLTMISFLMIIGELIAYAI